MKVQKGLNNNNSTSVPNAISNENFCFKSEVQKKNDTKTINDSDEKRLQSPVESHFALTPVTSSEASSPANGFSGHVCTDLLQEELDQLENSMKIQNLNETKEYELESSFSIETLTTPSEEHINMFSRNIEKETIVKPESVDEINNAKSDNVNGEVRFHEFYQWFLLIT